MFLIPAVIGHDRLMGGIADNEVACSAISAGPSFILMIIGAMILCYMIVNGLGGGKRRRKMRIAALIASVILILSGGGILFYQSLYNNVILRPDSITVNRNGSYTEYTLDEVQSFRVYASADDSLQMELNFKDGKSQKLFLGAAENTTAWSERYFSDYNYAAELAGKLAERGVSGSLDNKAALRRTVSTLDAQCAEGMDIIEQIVDGD